MGILPLIGISNAVFSSCRKYRYSLVRGWDIKKPICMFIGLNPSTADKMTNDATIRRCIVFAKGWGYGTLYMLNLFAFRSSEPENLKNEADPIGKDNDLWLEKIASKSQIIIAAWGNHGSFQNRSKTVLDKLPVEKVHVLNITNNLEPAHPLYIPKKCQPVLYQQALQLKTNKIKSIESTIYE